MAAIEIYRENDLHAFIGGIAEVGRDLGMARSAWFFRPMVYVVKLELVSGIRPLSLPSLLMPKVISDPLSSSTVSFLNGIS